jgi:aconitate hydratase
VLPLQFDDGVTRHTLGLNGTESFTIRGLSALQPRQTVAVDAERSDGARLRFLTLCRIDTADELAYYLNGGILPYVLRNLAA